MTLDKKQSSISQGSFKSNLITLWGRLLAKSGVCMFLPETRKAFWRHELPSEIAHWDAYIRTRGRSYGDNLADHYLNPDLPLQDDVVELLPNGEGPYLLLDVGAGPFTFLGKKHDRLRFKIVAVDPLADAYDQCMARYSVQPLVRTEKLAAECLTERFQENTLDLAFARNCLDHSYDPEKAILQMVKVVKPGRYVLLKHEPNVADSQRFHGLHQWNFRETSGDFVIASKWKSINMTQKHKAICSIECSYDDQKWLITRIRKN
jgi:SAM-dependent methyltransferase